MYTDTENEEFNINDINSVLTFIKGNLLQIFLFILVFIIIYIVDCISNFNAMIFAMPSPIPVIQPQVKIDQDTKIHKNIRKRKIR